MSSSGGSVSNTGKSHVSWLAALGGMGMVLGASLLCRKSSQQKKAPVAVALQVPTKPGDLDEPGRVIIVTGGANGIGSGCCREFARRGNTVVCCDVDEDAGKGLVLEDPAHIHFVRCNVAVELEIVTVVKEVADQFGRIDVLVNNVGVQLDDGKCAEDLDLELWDRVIRINLTSYFLFAKYSLPYLKQHPGSAIVNVASVQGLASQQGIPAYAASKGGVLSLTRQLAMDYAAQGVRVNAICPGTIRTPLVDNLFRSRDPNGDSAAFWAKCDSVYPMKRVGEMREVASAVCFLASADQASFITGQHLVVDGGIMALGGWADAG